MFHNCDFFWNNFISKCADAYSSPLLCPFFHIFIDLLIVSK